MLVRDVMTTHAVTVRPDARVKQAIELLDDHQITAMPVVDGDGRLVGVVSEADVLRDALLPDRRAHEIPSHAEGRTKVLTVGDVMTRLPMSVTANADLAAAASVLVDTAIKSLPVVDGDGRVVGIVSRRDVIAVLAKRDPLIEAEVDELLRAAEVAVRGRGGRWRRPAGRSGGAARARDRPRPRRHRAGRRRGVLPRLTGARHQVRPHGPGPAPATGPSYVEDRRAAQSERWTGSVDIGSQP